MTRKHADYEYQVGEHMMRVERYGDDGWIWRVFWADGTVEAESDHGDHSRLKRIAKARGLEYIEQGQAA